MIGPVFAIIVRKKANIGHEDSGVEIDSVPFVPMIPGVGLTEIPIGVGKIELTPRRAEVVSRYDCRASAELKNHPGAGVLAVKVAAHAGKRNLK